LPQRRWERASIALELWALPKSALGEFLAGIPSPLVIGNIELEDGLLVKGFLCESSGLGSAEDISVLGGWRSYLDSQAELTI
jgi:allophanate hydrolase